MLNELGGFLDVSLYQEALIHLFGGKRYCESRLPVTRNGIELGTHMVHRHSKRCGFIVTSMGDESVDYERHLRTLLTFIPISTWQWINIYRNQMRLITLDCDKGMETKE